MSHDANLDWIDDVAVERIIAGQPVGRAPTAAEKAAAVRELDRRGCTPNAIAERVGMRTAAVRRLVGQVPA